MARKRYLTRVEDEILRAGHLTAWHIHEVPRDGIEQPKDGVTPMQPLFHAHWRRCVFHDDGLRLGGATLPRAGGHACSL